MTAPPKPTQQRDAALVARQAQCSPHEHDAGPDQLVMQPDAVSAVHRRVGVGYEAPGHGDCASAQRGFDGGRGQPASDEYVEYREFRTGRTRRSHASIPARTEDLRWYPQAVVHSVDNSTPHALCAYWWQFGRSLTVLEIHGAARRTGLQCCSRPACLQRGGRYSSDAGGVTNTRSDSSSRARRRGSGSMTSPPSPTTTSPSVRALLDAAGTYPRRGAVLVPGRGGAPRRSLVGRPPAMTHRLRRPRRDARTTACRSCLRHWLLGASGRVGRRRWAPSPWLPAAPAANVAAPGRRPTPSTAISLREH